MKISRSNAEAFTQWLHTQTNYRDQEGVIHPARLYVVDVTSEPVNGISTLGICFYSNLTAHGSSFFLNLEIIE